MQPPALSAIPMDDMAHRLRMRVSGRLHRVVGLLAEGTCPGAAIGDEVAIAAEHGPEAIAEVIGLRDGRILLVGRDDLRGIRAGAAVTHRGHAATVPCSDHMIGRVLDGAGRPLDVDAGPIAGPHVPRPLHASAPDPLERPLVEEPLLVGIRAIDGLLTLGRGQRMGIFAGAGVGKSTLLGNLARQARADVMVLALVGERGREVGEFLERTLDEGGRRRSVTVVATSDRSPVERVRAAHFAHTIAEHFASAGRSVLLMMDSLTRFAMAQREIGLSMGEPPATRGYPPSVFAALPRLLERAGTFPGGGSITALYTVLVEGDDMSDPVADSARAILDGHLVLSRELAARGHFPAIDVLASISRVADQVLQPAQTEVARRMRALLADLKEAEELRAIGALVPGALPRLDEALARREAVLEFLRQGREPSPFPQTFQAMMALTEGLP